MHDCINKNIYIITNKKMDRKLRIDVGRTREEQKYRDTLATSLRKLRSMWNETWRALAWDLLESEQETREYKVSIWLERIDEKNIDYIIKHWNLKFLIKNLDKVKWFSHKEIADKLIENKYWSWLAAYLDKFEWIDHNEIVSKLIDIGEWRIVEQYIHNFKWLNKETAFSLIENWYEALVFCNLNKFKWLERLDYKNNLIKRLVKECFRNDRCFFVLMNELNRIDWLDLQAVESMFYYVNYLEKRLRERKYGHYSKSTGDAYEDTVKYIWNLSDTIKYKKLPWKIVKWIMDNFENFDNSSRVWFAKILYDQGCLQKYLDKFSPSEQKAIALDLIDDGKWGFVVKYMDKFHWLDEDVLKKLIEEWYWKYVSKYLEKSWFYRKNK